MPPIDVSLTPKFFSEASSYMQKNSSKSDNYLKKSILSKFMLNIGLGESLGKLCEKNKEYRR